MTRGRLAGVVVAVVAAVVAGVAVSGRGTGSPVAAAATKSADASTAHIALSLAVQSPKLAAGKELHVSGSGVVDGASADVSVRLGSLLGAVQAPADAPSSVRAIVLQQAGDDLAFVHLTPMPALAGGKSWVEVDLSKLASAHGLDLGALVAGGTALLPAQMLDLLKNAGATVTDLGPATVGGASTTRYRVLLDLAEVAKAAGLPSALVDELGTQATRQVPVNVWIGTDGLVHRVRVAYSIAQTHASFTATLSDYGANVSISAPPSADVLDATGLLTSLGGIRPLS
jgi:hypothetical protein